MMRRAILLGAGLVVLILLGLGVKGCLDARKRSALQDYARNVNAIVSSSNQASRSFFSQLQNPKALSTTEYEAAIAADRDSVDSLATRVAQMSVPGDMKGAQQSLLLTFQLRRDALTQIARKLPTALGQAGRMQAIGVIASQMKTLLASDVLYSELAKPTIESVLKRDGIHGQSVPDGNFLPDESYLDPNRIQAALGAASGAGGTTGTTALGLIQVSANGTVLQSGTPATVSAAGQPELEVQVQNQGGSTVSGATVSVTVSGGSPIQQQVSKIDPGQIQTVKIPLTPPPTGKVSLQVQVQPPGGGQASSNLRQSFTVTFQ